MPVRSIVAYLGLLAVAYCSNAIVEAADIGWRNDGTGRFAATNPPTSWSAEENIAWKVKLPGRSLASPIVVGDRVFVTANPAELLCYSARDGELLWSRSHGYTDVFGAEKGDSIRRDHERADELQKQAGKLHEQRREAEQAGNEARKQELQQQISALEEQARLLRAYPPAADGEPGNTGPTPTSDGTNVYTLFGTGVVSSHRLDGTQNWFTFAEAGGSDQTASPLLVDGKLIVHLRNLLALDAATGELLWQAETPSRHGSPVSAVLVGTPVIITPAGAVVRLADGEILARDQFRLGHSSPLVHDDMVYALEDGAIRALQLKLVPGEGDRKELPVVWEVEGSRTNRLASPILHEGLLYGVTEQGVLEVTDAKTGERVYRQRLEFEGGRTDPSLCLAGGLIYLSSNRGTTLVIRPGREFEEVASNELATEFSSSLCFSGSRIFVRGKEHLWCIGQ